MLTFWAAPPPARLYGPSKEQAGAGSRLFRSQTSGGWSDSHPPGFSHLKTAFRPPRCKSTRGPTRLPPVRTRPRPRRPRAGTRLIPVSPAGGRTAPTRSLGHAWCPVCSLLCDVSGFVLGDFSAKIFEISCTTWGCGGGGGPGRAVPLRTDASIPQTVAPEDRGLPSLAARPHRRRLAPGPRGAALAPRGLLLGVRGIPHPRKPRPCHADDPPREHPVSVLAFVFHSLLSPQGLGAHRGCFSHKRLYPCLHASGFGVLEEPPESTCWAVGGPSGLLLGPVLARHRRLELPLPHVRKRSLYLGVYPVPSLPCL